MTVLYTDLRGRTLLESPLLNKGISFTAEERRELGLEGLLPPCLGTIESQLAWAYQGFSRFPEKIDKYIFLRALQDMNEVLYYRLVHEHIEEMAPIIYTPTVGLACQRFSHVLRRPRGDLSPQAAGDVVLTKLLEHSAPDHANEGTRPRQFVQVVADPNIFRRDPNGPGFPPERGTYRRRRLGGHSSSSRDH